MLSPDVWVALNPTVAYPQLAQAPVSGSAWLAWRRPLLTAFILGCGVSLITSGRLTLRLVGPATIYWSFVPLLEIAPLAALPLAALWRRRQPVSFPRAIDLCFTGHGPMVRMATLMVTEDGRIVAREAASSGNWLDAFSRSCGILGLIGLVVLGFLNER